MLESITEEVLSNLTEDELLSQLETVDQQKRNLKELDTLLRDELTRRHQRGDIEVSSFTHNDYNFFYSDGKAVWKYPTTIASMEEDIEAAKARAQADGSAIRKIGAPFWTIKPPADHE